ncbi:MAG: hypothetical protein KAX05_03960 [Bacteroidales bacterium]|nr:hypothetical protein [Bacteroidales bacterium]
MPGWWYGNHDQSGKYPRESVVFSIANALGFGLVLFIFSGIREQLDLVEVPKAMKGVPIAFVVAGLLAMAFMGFAGIV